MLWRKIPKGKSLSITIRSPLAVDIAMDVVQYQLYDIFNALMA